MKPPIESPQVTQQKSSAATGNSQAKPAIEPPKEPFIILDDDGPGDPTKFQRFIVPMEFIEKANAVELPRLNPEDLVDTAPPHRPLLTPEQSSQVFAEGAKIESTDVASTALQPTVVVAKRRKSAPIDKKLLDDTGSEEHKPLLNGKLLWLFGGVLVILILLWAHWNTGTGSTAVDSNASVGASVSQVATPPVEPPVVALPSKARSVPTASGDNRDHTNLAPVATVPSKPETVLSTKRSSNSTAKAPRPGPAPKTATVAPSPPPTASSSVIGKTPWFIQND
jgi:hypothetical protein